MISPSWKSVFPVQPSLISVTFGLICDVVGIVRVRPARPATLGTLMIAASVPRSEAWGFRLTSGGSQFHKLVRWALNRETKRMMQRQGQIDGQGQPVASRPQPRPNSANAKRKGPRTTPLSYFRDVRNEMRKVAWATRSEVRNYSTVVFVAVAVMMAIIFGLDYGFSQGAVFLFK
jgi:preprotein translocase subunit SecE